MQPYMFSEEPPPEVKQEMMKRLARRVALRTDIKHMLGEMQVHHLWVMKTMFESVLRSEEPGVDAGVITGLITGYLENRGVCGGCGIDHLDEELRAEIPPGMTLDTNDVRPYPPRESFDAKNELSATREFVLTLARYNVSFVPTDDQPERVQCTGRCKSMTWPSLEDRIDFGGPDECPRCIDTTKWG